MTLYTDRKPIEEVAKSMAGNAGGRFKNRYREWDELRPAERDHLRFRARAALRRLRELGFITSEGLDAIHAEEDANGEPRSSVVPGSGR